MNVNDIMRLGDDRSADAEHPSQWRLYGPPRLPAFGGTSQHSLLPRKPQLLIQTQFEAFHCPRSLFGTLGPGKGAHDHWGARNVSIEGREHSSDPHRAREPTMELSEGALCV